MESLRITLEATETGVPGYVYLRDVAPGEAACTEEVAPAVMADHTGSGELLGVESLDAGPADARLTRKLAKQLGGPELAGINLAATCKTPK